jgi:hypothetical protein
MFRYDRLSGGRLNAIEIEARSADLAKWYVPSNSAPARYLRGGQIDRIVLTPNENHHDACLPR